jgi:predicted CoA-binding protein
MAMPDNLPPLKIEQDSDLRALLARSRRIAVLGIKPEHRSDRPAYFVPAYLAKAGYEVIPVPVYYPNMMVILARPVYRRLDAIPGAVDIVVLFRRSEHLLEHLPDILAKRPGCVWFQSGIRNDSVAAEITDAGIAVVEDRCIMVEHRRLLIEH